MENFNELKNRLLDHESPLELDSEWKALVQKRENIALKTKLSDNSKLTKWLLGLFLFCLIGGSVYIAQLESSVSNDKVELANDTKFNPTVQTQKNKTENRNSRKPTNSLKDKKHKEEQIAKQKSKSSLDAPKAKSEGLNNSRTNSSVGAENNKQSKLFAGSTKIEGSQNTYEINNKKNQQLGSQVRTKQYEEIETKSILPKIDNIPFGNNEKSLPINKNKEQGELLKLKPLPANMNNQFLEPTIKEKTGIGLPKKYKRLHWKNYASLELLGQGGFYSINLGRVLRYTQNSETKVQLGVAIYPKKINNTPTGMIPLFVPLSLSQSIKVKPNNYIAFGLGITLVNDKLEGEPNDFYFFGNLKLGYEYQKPNSRWLYKASFQPTLEFGDIFLEPSNRFNITNFRIWGGLGVAYKF